MVYVGRQITNQKWYGGRKKTYFNEFSRSDDKRKHRAIAGDEEKTAGRNEGRRIINYI